MKYWWCKIGNFKGLIDKGFVQWWRLDMHVQDLLGVFSGNTWWNDHNHRCSGWTFTTIFSVKKKTNNNYIVWAQLSYIMHYFASSFLHSFFLPSFILPSFFPFSFLNFLYLSLHLFSSLSTSFVSHPAHINGTVWFLVSLKHDRHCGPFLCLLQLWTWSSLEYFTEGSSPLEMSCPARKGWNQRSAASLVRFTVERII